MDYFFEDKVSARYTYAAYIPRNNIGGNDYYLENFVIIFCLEVADSLATGYFEFPPTIL